MPYLAFNWFLSSHRWTEVTEQLQAVWVAGTSDPQLLANCIISAQALKHRRMYTLNTTEVSKDGASSQKKHGAHNAQTR